MARVRLVYNMKAFEALMKSPEVESFIEAKTKAVEDACNAQSSWGGYHSDVSVNDDRIRGRVWSSDNRNDEARDNRLIHNLDAG
jgi:hypothetical protein